jgi:hypothetical protein
MLQNQYAKKRKKAVFYIHFDIFIFENKVVEEKCKEKLKSSMAKRKEI